MHIPKYWAKGTYEGFVCYRSSDRSVDDARYAAESAARQNAERLKYTPLPLARQSADSYGYPKGPMREETIEEIDPSRLVITRNAMGCTVLNCSDVLFVDIDLPEAPPKSGGFFQSLFGKQSASETGSGIETVVDKVASFVRATGDGARVYRTKGGVRVLFTNRTFSPNDGEVRRCFEALQADPLYVRLCAAQESFRARLTPKPFRCGCSAPTKRWPYESESEREEFESWLSGYESAAGGFATCQFLSAVGAAKIDRRVAPVVELHDRETRASSALPLA